MKLSKDEAWILAEALDYAQVSFSDERAEVPTNLHIVMNKLIDRLEEFSFDARRQGRTSNDTFDDCLTRYIEKKLKEDDTPPPNFRRR